MNHHLSSLSTLQTLPTPLSASVIRGPVVVLSTCVQGTLILPDHGPGVQSSLRLSQVCMDRVKHLVHIGFSAVCSFWHPLAFWSASPVDRAGNCYTCKCSVSDHDLEFSSRDALVRSCVNVQLCIVFPSDHSLYCAQILVTISRLLQI